ncbi:MAG: outer membrane protein assembly factor [Geobacteraceae bacterium]
MLLFGTLLLVLPRAVFATEPVEIIVNGVEDELQENVQAALALPTGLVKDGVVNLPWLELFREDIPQNAREALEPFGYYNAQVNTVLKKPAENEYRILVNVTPGKPVTVKEVTIRLRGPGAEEAALKRIARSFRLRKGDILVQSSYERGKSRLQSKALELGYLDATFTSHQIQVSRSEASARITLEMDTGPQYRFGETIFTGAPQFPDRFLQRYLDYKSGEIFSETKLAQSQINLSSSDRFKGVLLSPEREDAHDNIMPVLAQLSPQPRQRLRPGIGYGTDTGVRGTVRYKDVNLFHLGHEINAEIKISQRLQGIAAGYLAPSYRDARSSLGLQVNFQREDTDSYTNRVVSVEGTWNRTLLRGQLLTIYLKPQWEAYTVGSQKSTSVLVLPGIRFNQRDFDDLIRPRKGFSYTLEGRGTHQYLGSSTGLFQLITSANTVLPLPWRFSLISRVMAGVTFQNEPLKELPASLRFFAGGDRSVRGYAYQSLGPKDATGTVIGGKNLLTMSVELDRALFKNWALAGFFDAGNAFDSLGNLRLYKGAGVGIRYFTPIGAIKLDLARQIAVDNPSYRVHFSVGFEL